MNTQTSITDMNDFFLEKSKRNNNVSYAAVINTYNHQIHKFLLSYYGAAIHSGAVIENKLENPTNEQIAYMTETIGSDFNVSSAFISSKLTRWIQTLSQTQANILSESMYSLLIDLRNMGKNDSVLKNAYIKFMCWLYYRFQSVLTQIGRDTIPKIIYEGTITNYELYMLEMLLRCGCDILILDYGAQDKVKSESMFPKSISVENANAFPTDFSIQQLKKETISQQKLQNICGPDSTYKAYKNGWLDDINMNEITKTNRAADNMICSSFIKFNGVEDRNAYLSQLYKLYDAIKDANRNITIVEHGIPQPTPDEINSIKRSNCSSITDIMAFISANLRLQDAELMKYAKHKFCGYLTALNASDDMLHKTEQSVVKMLAVFNRYANLFSMKTPGCIFVLETSPLSKPDYEFLEFLSDFPIDIVIFNPSNIDDSIQSSVLETTYSDTLTVNKFPTETTDASYSTTAFNAENDLTSMMYQDTGMYRNRQYQKAEPIILKTMYEEIEILWDEDVSMRPGFNTTNEKVIIPTIFAKICGVKNANKKAYIKSIEKLVVNNDNVLYIRDHVSFLNNASSGFGSNFSSGLSLMADSVIGSALSSVRSQSQPQNSRPANLASVMTKGQIDEELVRKHELFKFNYLRDETISFMIDGVKKVIESGTIDGIGKNGAENTFLTMFFNLPKEIVTLIQKFDFTKINPKIVYTNSGESTLTLEETMLFQYLSFLGFDIVMFIPTGYNTVEKYFNKKLFTEYQIGDYMYDLSLDIRKKKGFFK